MKYFKYIFNEDEWTIYLISDTDDVVTDLDTAAEVKFIEREIYFRVSSVVLEVICHELWHVYFSYCYLSDTNNMDLHDIEEVSANLFADKGQRIFDTAKVILQRLQDMKKGKD